MLLSSSQHRLDPVSKSLAMLGIGLVISYTICMAQHKNSRDTCSLWAITPQEVCARLANADDLDHQASLASFRSGRICFPYSRARWLANVVLEETVWPPARSSGSSIVFFAAGFGSTVQLDSDF
jgi:hypothetical protein